MKTAIDSSVLFDILKNAPGAARAQTALEAALGQGSVCACAVVVAELGRYFDKEATLLAFLNDCQIDFEPLNQKAALATARFMRAYAANKGSKARVTADFLIGAHALTQCDALLTTDAGFFREYFSDLRVISP